jgi:hypothetical protein
MVGVCSKRGGNHISNLIVCAIMILELTFGKYNLEFVVSGGRLNTVVHIWFMKQLTGCRISRMFCISALF